MVAPAVAILAAAAIAAGAKAAGDAFSNAQQRKAAKRRAKETKRETFGDLASNSLQRSTELAAHGISSRNKMAKSKGESASTTADLVREALKI